MSANAPVAYIPAVRQAIDGFRPMILVRIGNRMRGSKIGSRSFTSHAAAHFWAILICKGALRRLSTRSPSHTTGAEHAPH